MVRELVAQATDLWNQFPSGANLTKDYSPAAIVVTSLAKPNFNQFWLEFGSYVQLYNGTTNTMKSHTFGASHRSSYTAQEMQTAVMLLCH